MAYLLSELEVLYREEEESPAAFLDGKPLRGLYARLLIRWCEAMSFGTEASTAFLAIPYDNAFGAFLETGFSVEHRAIILDDKRKFIDWATEKGFLRTEEVDLEVEGMDGDTPVISIFKKGRYNV